MVNGIDKRLDAFTFPVEETAVYTDNSELTPLPNLSNDYKAIIRKDNGKLIGIQRKTYKLIPNAEVIKPLLEQLQRLDSSWYIDSSHSFADDQRMRLQVTFPELLIHDGRSDIALSLYLHNSYDGSEGVRMFFGAIRSICKNGMVFGKILSKFYGKHTMGFEIENLHRELTTVADKLPIIKHRIDGLLEAKVDKDFRIDTERQLGKRVMKYIDAQEQETRRVTNQWALYNIITYYISHHVKQRMRADYQLRASKLFGL